MYQFHHTKPLEKLRGRSVYVIPFKENYSKTQIKECLHFSELICITAHHAGGVLVLVKQAPQIILFEAVRLSARRP